MSLRIRNKWKYKDSNRWDWEAFIDDDGSGELEDVDYVEYVLHPTFPNPIRKVKDPNNKFELKTNGWGTFNLKAFAVKNDGSKVKMEHVIELSKDPEDGISG